MTGFSTAIRALSSCCRKKNRCYKRRKCVYYDYSDLARRNFDICYELLLRIENGDIRLKLEDNAEDKEK